MKLGNRKFREHLQQKVVNYYVHEISQGNDLTIYQATAYILETSNALSARRFVDNHDSLEQAAEQAYELLIAPRDGDINTLSGSLGDYSSEVLSDDYAREPQRKSIVGKEIYSA